MTIEQRIEMLEDTLARIGLSTYADADGGIAASFYPSKYSGEEIDYLLSAMEGVVGKGSSSQQLLNRIGAGVRPNLLDNAYFVGGGSQKGKEQFPINQVGETNWSTAGSVFDRWKLANSNGSAELVDSGLIINATSSGTTTLRQVKEIDYSRIAGKWLTLSLLRADGNLFVCSGIAPESEPSPGTDLASSPSSQDQRLYIQWHGDGQIYANLNKYYTANPSVTFVAAKLEEGEGQTLAYQDSTGVWKLLPQPDMDYTTKLARCQRCLIPINTEGAYCGSIAASGAAGRFFIPTPIMMRANPVIQDAVFNIVSDGTNASLSGASFTPKSFPNGVEIAFSGVSGLSPNQAARVFVTTAGFLSAQL